MKWINAGERMPIDGSNVIFRVVGDNQSIILSDELAMKIYAVQQINLEKTGNHQLPFEIDISKFEWLDESFSEENIAFVIRNTKTNEYLNNCDYFTSKIRNARIFSKKDDAINAMNSYTKIYKETTSNSNCEFLEVLPVEMQIIKIDE
jgi:hypothetical protein